MNLLLVDDDPVALGYLEGVLRLHHDVTACTSGQDALARLAARPFDAVFTDLRMPPPDGFQILKAARALKPAPPVVVLTAVDQARPAVDALRLGASDFLVKPAARETIAAALARIQGQRPAAVEPDFGLVGCTPSMRLVRRLIPALARTRETVLICGETGTGKELLARALHAQSSRHDRAFVAHNMAATPPDLAESIFLGHVRGAFSGALTDHAGLFEQADGGTLFLDEIDSFPVGLQAKLLRVLEGGPVCRVGATAGRDVNVRVIAASASDLCAQVESGGFRADLYYRLRQLEIALPPLRERHADIPHILRHVLGEWERASGVLLELEAEAMERLIAHSWPGNVRELRNVVRAAAVMAGPGPIRVEHFPRALRAAAAAASRDRSLKAHETRHILEVLESVAGNQSQAARILGIDRGTLARKLSAAYESGTPRPDPERGL